MPALKYYLRDLTTGSIRQYPAEELQQLLTDTSKPVFFTCLGMDGFSGKTNPEKQIRCVEGFFDGYTPDDFHVVAIISGEEKFTDNKLAQYLDRFNLQGKDKKKGADTSYESEFDQPATFGMQLLKDLFAHSIPYAGYMNENEHHALVEQTRLKLSQYNWFGHSFGTVVLAEMYDYLHQLLHQKGFSEEEAASCLQCMGKLKAGNSYHILERHTAVPGIDFNSALDRKAQKYHNIPKQRDSDVLSLDRIGNDLQLSPLVGSPAVPTVRLKAKPEADVQERADFASKINPQTGKPDHPSPWELIVEEISDNSRHALQLYMYKDRLQLDRENARARFTGHAYPGTEIANGFMMDLFHSSAEAVRTHTPRDTRLIVDRLQEKLSPREIRDALAGEYLASQERFHRHFGTELPDR